jgi:hypothetical protein
MNIKVENGMEISSRGLIKGDNRAQMEGTRKTSNILSHGSRSPGLQLNPQSA